MNNKNEKVFNNILNNKQKKNFSRMSFIEKQKAKIIKEKNFKKIINTLILNTQGEKPLIMYQKSPNHHHKIGIKINNYLSDGGINKKQKKYFNLISNYSSKRKSTQKNKNNQNNFLNSKYNYYKSISYSSQKQRKNKNEIIEKSNLIKNKSKGEYKYNLLLNKYKNHSIIINENKASNHNNNNSNKKRKEKKIKDKKELIRNLIRISKIENKNGKNEYNQKLTFFGKKLKYLQLNNIQISKNDASNELSSENISEEQLKKINFNNQNKKIKKDNFIRQKKENDLNNNQKNNMIDQFEYIKKINIFHKANSKISKAYNIFKYYNLIKTRNKNNLNINTYKNLNNSKEETPIDDEYLYTHKKNKRKKEELKLFTREKKSKEKKENKVKEFERSEKIYKKYKNLYKLNLENIDFINKQNNRKKNGERSLKKRIKNNYYIGNDKNKNDSTFIEPEDYYVVIYQSKQLITNLNIENNDENLMKEEKYNTDKNKMIRLNNFLRKMKNFFRKKIFLDLYYIYFKNKYYQHYFLSFKYFIAIIKQDVFKKIYLYYIKNKQKANRKKIEENKNIINLLRILTFIIKAKVFEKLFNYYQELEIKIIKEKLEKIFNIIKRRFIRYGFEIIKSSRLKDSINEDINDELNINEKIMNNDNYNIYSDGLKNTFNEINNTDEKNKKFIKINDDFIFSDIKLNIERNTDFKNGNNISYINIVINNNLNNDNIPRENGKDKGNDLDDELEKVKEKKFFGINKNYNNDIKEKEFDELLGEIKHTKSYSECSGLISESKSSKENNNINENNKKKAKINKTNKYVNINLKKDIKIINIINEKDIEEIENNKKKEILFTFGDIQENNIDKFVNSLTEKIIIYICDTEINEKIYLLPKKYIQNNAFNNNSKNNNSLSNVNVQNSDIYKELNHLGIEHQYKYNNSLNLNLNNSLIFSSSTFSEFNKTIIEKKKELDEKLFEDKFIPEIIRIIKDELIRNHEKLLDYIMAPIQINEKDLFDSLLLNDGKNIFINNKIRDNKINNIIQKEILLNKINKVTNEIKNKYFISQDSTYDKILNECVIDSLIEIINNERYLYNNEYLAKLLKLSEQKNIISNDNYFILKDKNKFSNYICKSIISLILTKLEKKPDDLNIINTDKIKKQNEIKLNKEIKKELNILDINELKDIKIEEMKIKLKLSNSIFNELLKETVNILINVQNTRMFPGDNNEMIFQNNEDIYNNDFYDDFEDDIINY